MTARRDLSFLLAAYLGDGPVEAPDRAIEAALDEIGAVPQVRRLPLPWRSPMSSRVRILLAAAALVVVAVAAAFYVGGQPPTTVPPSSTPGLPTPSVAASSPSPAAVVSPSPRPVAISIALEALGEVDRATTAARSSGLTQADQDRLFQLHDAIQQSLEEAGIDAARPLHAQLVARVDEAAPRLVGAPGDRLRAAVSQLGNALDAVALVSGELAAGTYYSTGFTRPRIVLRLPAGWSKFVDDSEVVALRHGDVVLAFNHAASSATAEGVANAAAYRSVADFPGDIAAVTIGAAYNGFVGQAPPLATLWYTAGLQAFDPKPGDEVRVWAVAVQDRGNFTVELSGPPDQIADVLPEVEAMLDSILLD